MILSRWRAKYRTYGSLVLRDRIMDRLSERTKNGGCMRVLTKEESLTSAILRFNISRLSMLTRWIRVIILKGNY